MIRIRTLGGLSASRDDQPASGAATQPRRLAVLALVARAGDRGITRERLLALLWPDAQEEAGRRALSQALHALRSDLHDELFIGVQELRLNLAVAVCDVLDFEAAHAARDWERAVAAWTGPFLQGFRLAGAAEFDRWMEEERGHLAERYAVALERLAGMAMERGAPIAAAGWWRRRAALDPLNARITVELMRALAAAGERHAALQQAKIYEALVEQELALPPDTEVLRYAEELRRVPGAGVAEAAKAAGAAGQDPEAPTSPAAVAVPAVPAALAVPAVAATRAVLAVVAVVAVLAVLAFLAVLAVRSRRTPATEPLLAVGAIADHRAGAAPAPLTDLLGTGLARISGLQLVSTVRLLELIARDRETPGAASYASAARRAGASDLIEGGLHALSEGLLLEVRRVGLADGKVRGAWRFAGRDLFTLVDSATVAIAADVGLAPALGPGGVGTRSIIAWRFYEEGLHAYARGSYRDAEGLFEAALREDASFAMAAYYGTRARHERTGSPYPPADLARLERLAGGAGDRERLQILAWVAHTTQSPTVDALADSLITRYPADLEAQYLAGFARMARAEFAAALPFLHRVIAADSVGAGTAGGRCLGCDAMNHLLYAYHALDSLDRVEQLARDWVRRDSTSALAWSWLGTALDIRGRPEEAIAARRKATPFNASDDDFPIGVRIRAGDFTAADRAARALMEEGSNPESAWQGFLMYSISLHHQARWRELLALNAQWLAKLPRGERLGLRGSRLRMSDALSLLEAGRPAEAGRILDSMTRHYDTSLPAGIRDRDLAMFYALQAEAALAAGNTGEVVRAADSARAAATRAAKARERGFATHARALTHLARHDTATAMEEFERALYSTTLGYTRTNHHLARLLLARGQPAKAAALLRPALQGGIGLVSFTNLHELQATAYDRLGRADSARVHWAWVARALEHADPTDQPRHAAALTRLGTR